MTRSSDMNNPEFSAFWLPFMDPAINLEIKCMFETDFKMHLNCDVRNSDALWLLELVGPDRYQMSQGLGLLHRVIKIK